MIMVAVPSVSRKHMVYEMYSGLRGALCQTMHNSTKHRSSHSAEQRNQACRNHNDRYCFFG